MAKSNKPTDAEYIELDNTIGGVLKFEQEIRWYMAKCAVNPSAVAEVLGAMRSLHDGALAEARKALKK